MATTSPPEFARPLLTRADAGAQIGAGHVMRCLALAQAWRLDGGAVTLAAALLPDALAARAVADGIAIRRLPAAAASVDDLHATIDLAKELSAEWVVLDGYAFGAAYERGLAEAGLRLLALDDEEREPHAAADLVLNQNLYARGECYPGRSLTGGRFALLRREFLAHEHEADRRDRRRLKRIVVTLGGGHAGPALPIVLDALRAAVPAGVTIDLVAQPSPQDRAGVEQRIRQFAPGAIEWRERRDDMATLLAGADLAISAAGSTTWELMCLGVPALVTAIADNQRRVADAAAAAGAVVNLGPVEGLTAEAVESALRALLTDDAARARLGAAGRQTIDGQGAARTVQAMTGAPLRLRRARAEDARLLWEWANDADTRAASFNSDPIPWQTHVAWLDRALADPSVDIWIGVDADDRDAGVGRFQPDGDGAAISVALAPSRRGQGLGAALITAGSRRTLAAGRRAIAYVRPANAASLAAFRRAGYQEAGRTEVRGQAAIRLELSSADA